MSSTFATRLTGAEGRDLSLCVVVQGISDVFQEDSVDVADAIVSLAGFGTGASRTRRKIIEKIEVSAKTLDLEKRRMIGGSCTITLIETGTVLSSLFAPKTRRAAFQNVPTMSAATTTQNVSSTTAFAASGVAYIDGETITYTSLGAAPARLLGLTRGAFGSVATVHFGGTEQGAGVFTVPPSWLGRRVKLVGYFTNDDGTSTASLGRLLDTYRLEEPPVYVGDGRWELRCSHLSDEFASRKLGSGIRDVESGVGVTDPGAFGINFTVDLADVDQFEIGAVATHVIVKGTSGADVPYYDGTGLATTVDPSLGASGAAIYAISGEAAGVVTLDTSESLVVDGVAVRRADTLRHIAVMSGDIASTLIFQILTSRNGDAVNGAGDVLPGKTRDSFGGGGWRMGAGIETAEVDSSFYFDGAVTGVGPEWSFVIDTEIDVEKLLADYCFATSTIWYASAAGLLSIKRLGEQRSSSVLTLTDANIVGEPQVSYDETSIYPRVSLRCNYDPVNQKFLKTVNIIDDELAARYPSNEDRLEIESRSLVVGGMPSGTLSRPSIPLASVETMLRRVQQANGRGRCVVDLTAHLDALVCELGDAVTLTVAVPDLEGAASISGRTCRVIKIGPDYDKGTVDLTLEIIEELFSIAPAAVVLSIAGLVITLYSSLTQTALQEGAIVLQEGGDLSPGAHFFVNEKVDVYDVSGGIKEAGFTVTAVSATTVTLNAVPGTFVLAAGDVIVSSTETANNAMASSTINPNGGELIAVSQYLYQMPDDEQTLGATEPETRWR